MGRQIGGWVDRQMWTHSKRQAARRTHRQMDGSVSQYLKEVVGFFAGLSISDARYTQEVRKLRAVNTFGESMGVTTPDPKPYKPQTLSHTFLRKLQVWAECKSAARGSGFRTPKPSIILVMLRQTSQAPMGVQSPDPKPQTGRAYLDLKEPAFFLFGPVVLLQ